MKNQIITVGINDLQVGDVLIDRNNWIVMSLPIRLKINRKKYVRLSLDYGDGVRAANWLDGQSFRIKRVIL